MEGYHFGTLSGALVAAMVLIINLCFTIWAVSSFRTQNGLGTLYDGSCKRTRTLAFWIHLAINVFSTLLLSASNYSMQCLSSPTRGEIDKAHGQGIWLDIGVPSVRNLRRLSPIRVAFWWLLAISSIPLHLLYNSAVFSSLCTRQYNVFLVSNEFLLGAPFDMTSLLSVHKDSALNFTEVNPYMYLPQSDQAPTLSEVLPDTLQVTLSDTLRDYQKNSAAMVSLNNSACIEAYTAPIFSTKSDLLVVCNYTTADNSLLALLPNVESRSVNTNLDYALCLFPGTCDASTNSQNWSTDDFARTIANPKNYSFFSRELGFVSEELDQELERELDESMTGKRVQYCLSQRVEEHCKLQFSLVIMIIVIICNLMKTVCMAWIAWKQDPEPLVTLGDAVVSFLDRPDITTKGCCIKDKSQFEGSRSWTSLPSKWNYIPVRWFRTASERRWFVCNIL